MTDNRYKYYLDGSLYDDPMGWDGWKTKLMRDNDLRGIVEQQEGKVTFHGAAYDYIYTKRQQGFCASVSVEIWEDCSRSNNFKKVFEGNIFLSETIFNLSDCTCECDLVDDSYYAKIESNKQIECSIGAGKSKNGVDIAVPDLWDIQMFNPCDGVDSGLPKPKAYRAHDIAKNLIEFMSDGQMLFESTALDIGGEFEGLFLTKGMLIGDPTNPETGIIFKWEQFLADICKACDLAWRVRRTPAGWLFSLERSADLFTTAISKDFPNVYPIRRQIDQSRNYAAVELGTDNILESLGCGALGGSEPAFPDQINLLGCKREQFAVTGTCNINSVLDLTISWIISSNIVENIYFNGDDGYDEDVIVLDCTTLNATNLTASAIKHDVFGNGAAPYYYNANYFNKQIAERNFRGIPATLVKYLNYPDTGFKARFTGSEVLTFPPTVVSGAEVTLFPFPFGDDYTAPQFDLNNDYGNGTLQGSPVTQVNSRYDAPAQNVYKFRVTHSFAYNAFPNIVKVTFHRFDAGLTLIASYQVTKNLSAYNAHANVQFDSPLIFMNATDVLAVRTNWEIIGPSVGSTFELTATGTQGGEFEIITEGEYIADMIMFSAPLSMADFKNVQQNITDKITADDGKNQVAGWIDAITYNRHTNMAEITLITDGR